MVWNWSVIFSALIKRQTNMFRIWRSSLQLEAKVVNKHFLCLAPIKQNNK